MAYEADIRILGGLPVTVEYTIQGAEPDVGIMQAGVDDWWIVAVNGRYPKNEAKNPFGWLHARIDKTKGEEERIRDELNEAAAEADQGYYDDY